MKNVNAHTDRAEQIHCLVYFIYARDSFGRNEKICADDPGSPASPEKNQPGKREVCRILR